MAAKLQRKVVFTQRVDHPGTRAQPFLEPAGVRGRDFLEKVSLPKALKAIAKGGDLRKEIDKAVRAAALLGLKASQQLVPVRQGRLKASLTVAQIDEFVYSLGTNVIYAKWVEEGTKPHVILPRRKSVLRFVVKRPRVS